MTTDPSIIDSILAIFAGLAGASLGWFVKDLWSIVEHLIQTRARRPRT